MSLILQNWSIFLPSPAKHLLTLPGSEHISDLGVLAGTHKHDNLGQELGKQKLLGPGGGVGTACQRATGCTSGQRSSLCLCGRRMAAKK